MRNPAEEFLVAVARAMGGTVSAQRMVGLSKMRPDLERDFNSRDLTDALARAVGARLGENFPTYYELAEAVRQCMASAGTAVATVGVTPFSEAEMYAEVFGKMLAGQGRGPGGKTMGFKNPQVAASMARNSFPKEALDILRQRLPDLFPPEHCADRPRHLRMPRIAGIPPLPRSHAAPPEPPPRPQEHPLPDDVLAAERAKLKQEAR